MTNLAIKGHATRGSEVIEILRTFGGLNTSNYAGITEDDFYYIGKSGIICKSSMQHSRMVFTLEEFFEKFPYKIGDKVQYKWATSCDSVFEIEKMRWVDDHVEYTVKRLWCWNDHHTVTAENLQPYKEKTMEEKETFKEDDGTLVAIDLTREFKKADDIEVILGDYEFVLKNGKTYFVKRYKYPKTYEECCKVLKTPIDNFISKGAGYKAELLSQLQKLLICRDAYWKIAGEQIGETWEPDWRNNCYQKKWIINFYQGEINLTTGSNAHFVLAFPSEEMRDIFYENFKKLIEQCKEFL